MSETSNMSEVVFCGSIGDLMEENEYGIIIRGSMALAHLFCLCHKQYGLDSNFTPDNYKTKLANLMVDYMEMLLEYKKMHRQTMPYLSEGLKATFGRLENIEKSNLKNKIVSLTNAQNSYACKSWGNIAAACTYIVGYVGRSLDELRFMTEEVAKNTHNQPDAIKGCKAVTDFIFLTRCGWSMEAIKNWINCKYKVDGEPACAAYDMDKSCSDITKSYEGKKFKFWSQAKNTVSAALVSVFNADSFEKALENAKSIGGDTHVVCSITAELAAALWPIPEKYIQKVKNDLARKKASGKITIHIGQNYEKAVSEDIEPEEISKRFNQCYGKLQRNTSPLDWKLKNTKLAVESLKQDLEIADKNAKEDILKLLNCVTKDSLSQAQLILDNNSNLEIKNALLGEIKTLLEQYFPNETKLINDLKAAIGHNQNYDGMPAPIADNMVMDLSIEVSDNHGLLKKACYIGGLFIVISTSTATVVFAVAKLWLPLVASDFIGIILFGICHFIQIRICDKKANSNYVDNLQQDVTGQDKVFEFENGVPNTEKLTKNREK